MANQSITQLPIASAASSGDLIYIVDNYESGSPSLTGESAQIYFSAINQSLSSATLTNNVNNAVVTSTGTSPQLIGESNLTFDGTDLRLTGNTTVTGKGTFGTLQLGTGSTITATTTGTLISVKKSSIPAQSIVSGATPVIATSLSNFSNQQNWGEFSTTGTLTATKSSVYRMSGIINFANTAGTVGGEFALIIDKNGTEIVRSVVYNYSTGAYYRTLRVYGIVDVVPGDVLSFKLFQNGVSTLSFLFNSQYNLFIIEELPNILTK